MRKLTLLFLSGLMLINLSCKKDDDNGKDSKPGGSETPSFIVPDFEDTGDGNAIIHFETNYDGISNATRTGVARFQNEPSIMTFYISDEANAIFEVSMGLMQPGYEMLPGQTYRIGQPSPISLPEEGDFIGRFNEKYGEAGDTSGWTRFFTRSGITGELKIHDVSAEYITGSFIFTAYTYTEDYPFEKVKEIKVWGSFSAVCDFDC